MANPKWQSYGQHGVGEIGVQAGVVGRQGRVVGGGVSCRIQVLIGEAHPMDVDECGSHPAANVGGKPGCRIAEVIVRVEREDTDGKVVKLSPRLKRVVGSA